jgi:pyridoxal phosphate enzyme (YggS family)
MTESPQDRLQRVRDRIREAEIRFNRPAGSVRLIGVGKVHTAESIRHLVELGLEDIGENYVQEARSKQEKLRDLKIIWHYIGHIQSNKTREISLHFDWVHSVDRVKIARRLSDQRPADSPPLNVCLQVNLQHEDSKGGLGESDVFQAADEIQNLPRIRMRGLMAVPRPSQDFEEQRASFARVRILLESLTARGHRMDTLSLGMSDDMEAAIAEGSTMVRIGTALFGPRPARIGDRLTDESQKRDQP